MKWEQDGIAAFRRIDGRYMINRAPPAGFPATYTLVELGRASVTRNGYRMWEDSTLIETVAVNSAAERKSAVDGLMEKCDAPTAD